MNGQCRHNLIQFKTLKALLLNGEAMELFNRRVTSLDSQQDCTQQPDAVFLVKQ